MANRRKWAGRAAAEFALIVVGVLAALALEGWWTDLQERRAEEVYIADLRDELQRNVEALEGVSALREQAEGSLRRAIVLLEKELHVDSAEVFVVSLARGGQFYTFPRLSDAVFDDLRSSGRLQLIQSDELRRGIMHHYGRLDASLRRLAGFQAEIGSGLASLLASRLPTGLVMRDPDGSPVAWSAGPSGTSSAFRATAEALSMSPELLGQLRAELATLDRERLLLEHIQEILEEHRVFLADPDPESRERFQSNQRLNLAR